MSERPTYDQPVKHSVRVELLTHAVTALTRDRNSTSIIRIDEFRQALSYALSWLDRCCPGMVKASEVHAIADEWISVHETTVGRKEPKDLRVLYLCGPEPSNDLRVLLHAGVLPHNVWACEAKEDLFAAAIADLRKNQLFPRIHRGDIRTLFAAMSEHFDIIYIDACGPLPGGKPNTLLAPLELFANSRLTPLGALITNYTRPPPEKGREFARLMSYFFAPRYNDCSIALRGTTADAASAAMDPDYLVPFVQANLSQVYSEYITRLLVSIGRDLVPRAHITAYSDVADLYFDKHGAKAALARVTADPTHLFDPATPVDFETVGNLGDMYLSSGSYPLTSFMLRSKGDPAVQGLLEPLLGFTIRGHRLDELYPKAEILVSAIEGNWGAASPDFKRALARGWFDSGKQVFCDIAMPHLLANSMLGVYSRPHFANPRCSLRRAYTAQVNQMFTDCLIFDQCRSYFDFFPSMPLLEDRFRSTAFQLVVRAALDRVGRFDFSSGGHPFYGAALAGFGEYADADAYDFEERTEVITPDSIS